MANPRHNDQSPNQREHPAPTPAPPRPPSVANDATAVAPKGGHDDYRKVQDIVNNPGG